MSALNPAYSLVQLFFVRSVVISIPEHKPESTEEINTENVIDVRRDEQDSKVFVCSMRSSTNIERKPTYPYHIDMEAVCSLRQIDDTLDDALALRGATITAHSVLYGAIREATSWITSRQPWGQIQLGLSVLTTKAEAPGLGEDAEKASD
ncbi:hypothetical protein [Hydrogenophaga sp. PAMC20947]|uniref:hypothetical protein n=1 Tax=Hydrogenophaga sp. PAMC20947 TaxID=2565558 RepID=UPI00109E0DD9|nr:hypothetical protein [Hydrogenophaga sp. PAMC20947]QCB46620.1 hypothetical protein E5678_11650 [Hydrogenophaga sp. PAMC20947]